LPLHRHGQLLKRLIDIRGGEEAGFSLYTGVATQAHQRDKLEGLCCYLSHSAVSEKRVSLTSAGNICYKLKITYGDGTTHVAALVRPCTSSVNDWIFISKLALLVPKPRKNDG
jgi:hypothetical protein